MPRKTSVNWFMPALVNSSVGSFAGTSDDEWTSLCPFCTKKSRNLRRISEPVSMVGAEIYSSIGVQGSLLDGRHQRERRRKQIPRRFAPRNDKDTGRGRALEARPPGKRARRYCDFGLSSGSTAFFISCPVALVPFFTPLPVFLATFSVPLAVSFATTLVSWPVFSAPFSVSLPTTLATFLVSWPVAFAPFSVPFAVSFATTLVS